MIVAILVGTIITRFLAFAVFPAGRETPQFVQYLGRVLPPAVFGMLVIYCYKSVDVTTGNHGLPELIAGAIVVLLHKWKKNLFLSILSGVAIYMILLRLPLLY
jgi:branched-subunit amino acid transport protein AzlD